MPSHSTFLCLTSKMIAHIFLESQIWNPCMWSFSLRIISYLTKENYTPMLCSMLHLHVRTLTLSYGKFLENVKVLDENCFEISLPWQVYSFTLRLTNAFIDFSSCTGVHSTHKSLDLPRHVRIWLYHFCPAGGHVPLEISPKASVVSKLWVAITHACEGFSVMRSLTHTQN